MKIRPILFQTDMVRAIQAGTKTQTRRIVKSQPKQEPVFAGQLNGIKWIYRHSDKHDGVGLVSMRQFCPYGQVGDVLWVRETWSKLIDHHVEPGTKGYVYKADMPPGPNSASEIARQDYIKAGFPYQWKPSIHMPFEAARLFLKITDIRVERLQDITEADAIAEGVYCYSQDDPDQSDYRNYLHKGDDDWGLPTAALSYETLWQKINGPESCNANPFVWVVEFSQTTKPIQNV